MDSQAYTDYQDGEVAALNDEEMSTSTKEMLRNGIEEVLGIKPDITDEEIDNA